VLSVRTEPVDIEHEGAPARPVTLERILVPVDFSDCSLEALEYAIVVAQQAKASLMLMHVLEPVSYGLDFTLNESHRSESSTWTKRLEELISSHQHTHVPMEFRLRGGLPPDSILDCAQTLSCDLIVMGTHGRRGISHTISGSVAESVLRKSHCPVIAVRSPKFGLDHRGITPTEQSRVTHT
jgi:nucleotide-binding universal stress UspA family protein